MLQNRKRVGAKEKAVLLEHYALRIPQEEINPEVFSSLVIAGLFPRKFLASKTQLHSGLLRAPICSYSMVKFYLMHNHIIILIPIYCSSIQSLS